MSQEGDGSEPDQDQTPGGWSGGAKKRRIFARLIWQGMAPFDAFVKAGYEVCGVNSSGGHKPDQARARAEQMAKSSWCSQYSASWAVDPKDKVKSAVPEAIELLIEGLSHRDKDGKVTSLAVRCAENLLDRGQVIRSQKVETDQQGTTLMNQDARELLQLIRSRLEAHEKPVELPPALTGVIEMKKVNGTHE